MAAPDVPLASPVGIALPNPITSSKPPASLNFSNVVLGNLLMKPWYPSFYPDDLVGGRKKDWLCVCPWCFKYTSEIMKFCAHCKVCPMKNAPPPGEVIYQKGDYAIHRVDGEDLKLYSQNLGLFAKLFLETKSVFFDASTFLYYTLVLRSSAAEYPHGQVIGFFSKEKMSWDNNNVACILVFPPWQRRGLGQVLIAASYVLGKREGRFGGPEKPLSNLGRKGYIAYWSGEIARFILAQPKQKTIRIKDLSRDTWILPEDVITALQEMDVLEKRKTASGSIVVNKSKVKAWAEKTRASTTSVIDPDAFVCNILEGAGDMDDDSD